MCYLSFGILLVDPPLCKKDFSRRTFEPGRNIIPAVSQKGPGNFIKQGKVINSKS